MRVLLTAPPAPRLGALGERYRCEGDGVSAELVGPLLTELTRPVAAIQVGAFTLGEPRELVARLNEGGFTHEVRPALDGVTRVVVLGGAQESQAELAGRLRAAGFAEQQPVAPEASGRVSVHGTGGQVIHGRQVRVEPLSAEQTRLGERTYRGVFVLRPGQEGVHVVNTLGLESYLRGVVPAEMGPKTFGSLEALKAQAVAARTYAIARLGEHEAEGYDLCDTVQCQVYGGAGWEHPLTDQAVRDTAGEVVVFEGKPIQAYYHSTCGGHTEDGVVQFPKAAGPYLKGVPCRAEQPVSVGFGKAGPWLDGVERLATVARELAGAVGVAASPEALASRLGGREAPAGVVGLALALGVGDAADQVGEPGPTEESLLLLLEGHGLGLPARPRPASDASWELALVVRLGQLSGDIETFAGRLLPSANGAVVVPESGEPRPLTGRELSLERRAERFRRGRLEVLPGSPAMMWCVQSSCPVLEVSPMLAADAGSSRGWWARELSLAEIGRKLNLDAVRGVTVLGHGVSGRATAVRVATATGAVDMPGLAFRYALGLPDSRFSVLARQRGGVSVLRFLGRGWGHGVGMCQNGAFGLARGGATYREILRTYYTGVQVVRWPL